MKIIAEIELGNKWADPEILAEMTDVEVIELMHEDLIFFLEDAKWTVVR